jgi:hypothetical protein
MKEFLDEINSLILDYPENKSDFEEILDMCLKDIENGEDRNHAISIAKSFIWQLIHEDK